jgi:hypothetical protein
VDPPGGSTAGLAGLTGGWAAGSQLLTLYS